MTAPALPRGLALVLDQASPTPLYLQLAEQIRARVAEGAIRVGDAVPSERELSLLGGVSRVTVRKALDLLLREGLLSRRQGSGTYVLPRIQQSAALLAGFSAEMRGRGLEPGAVWIERGEGVATPEEAMALGLDLGARVVRLARVRTADGEPLAIERATVPTRFLPGPECVDRSLYEALAARGHEPARGHQRLQASLATPTEARLLAVPVGAAVLRIERRAYLADGRAVELTRSAYRGDRYDFIAEVRELRTGAQGRATP
ncbi:MAG: GntR family transcriptional regulator [Salinarimonas sp.]